MLPKPNFKPYQILPSSANLRKALLTTEKVSNVVLYAIWYETLKNDVLTNGQNVVQTS